MAASKAYLVRTRLLPLSIGCMTLRTDWLVMLIREDIDLSSTGENILIKDIGIVYCLLDKAGLGMN